MRIGFVTLGKNVPSTRFRFLAMVPYLRSRGHTLRLWTGRPAAYDHIPAIGWRASQLLKRCVRWQQLLSARLFRPDCIYLERGVFHDNTLGFDRHFRRLTPRLVLDVDDAIFLTFPEKIPQLIAMSDHVVASTPTLVEYVAQHTAHWSLIPTSVSMERYQPRPFAQTDEATSGQAKPLTVGWIGTAPNVAFLSVCAPALREIARQQPFRMLIVAPHDRFLSSVDLSGVDVQFITWQAEREIEHLHLMDIGLMPLPDGQLWMRYKAATKLIQYLAVGIPAIASPIGVNADILDNSRVGLAATTTDQWVNALTKLLNDGALRRRMGQQGRELVTSRFSIEANAPRLEEILTTRSP